MQSIEVFYKVLLEILGFLSLLGGVITLILKFTKNTLSKKNEERIEEHEKKINELEVKINDIEKQSKEHGQYINVLCTAMLALISHEINGNSMDKLQRAKDELEQFLINK